MAFDMEHDPCDLCSEPTTASTCEPKIFPGCEKSQVLNDHLRLYFILTKLLRCSEKDSLNLLGTFFVNSSDVNEPPAVFSACSNCEKSVNKAFDLHQKMLLVQSEISKIGQSLIDIIQLNQMKKLGQNYNRQKFRKLLCLGMGYSHSSNIKLEIDNDENLFENDGIDFDHDDVFDDDDDNQVYGVKIEEEAEASSTRRLSSNELDAGSRCTSPCEELTYTTSSDGNFLCKYCDSIYTTVPGIKKHERMHKESSLLGNKYDCSLCRHPTLSDSKLRRHMTAVHGRHEVSKGQFQKPKMVQKDDSDSDFEYNPRCTKKTDVPKYRATSHLAKFAKRRIKARAKRLAIAGTQKTFSCSLCECVYESLYALRRHLENHEKSNSLMNKFDCPQCKYPALSEQKLHRHINMAHETSKRTCDICNHDSSSRYLHEQHMLKEHNIPEMCPTPQISFDTSKCVPTIMHNETKAWEINSAEENTPVKTYNCKLCECKIVYTTTQGLRKHTLAHDQSKLLGNKYDCNYCHYPTISERSLRRHITLMHEPQDKDMINGNGSNSYKQMDSVNSKIHQSSTTSIDDPKLGLPVESSSEEKSFLKIYDTALDGTFMCKLCESTYTTVPGIKKHARMHIESNLLGNKYDCSLCRHPTLSDSKLRRHMTAVHESRQKKMDRSFSFSKEKTHRKVNRKLRQDDLHSSGEEGAKSDSKDDADWVPFTEISDKMKTELYHCGKCKVDYKSARGYQMHEEEHEASVSLGHKYDCHCGFPASSEKRLRYHRSRAHLDTCSICGYRVQEQEHLRSHMRKHYPSCINRRSGRDNRVRIRDRKSKGKIECKLCKTTYLYLISYNKHMSDHKKSKLIDGIWDCTICGFPCLNETSLRRHKVKHNGSKVACTICQKTVVRTKLNRHMQLHAEYDQSLDPETGLFRCKLCSYVGRSRQGLISHKTALHRDTVLAPSVEYLLCPQCGKSFYSHACLRKHIKNIHENKYTHTCDKCGKGFDSKAAFTNHQMTHEENRTKQHICECCGVSYSHRHTLQAHVTKYHSSQNKTIPASVLGRRQFPKEMSFKCKWCDSIFPFKYMLVSHMPTAHPDLYTFSCDQCEKKYTSASSLKLHTEIAHSVGNKTFSCEYCRRTYQARHYVLCHYKFCESKKKMDNQINTEK